MNPPAPPKPQRGCFFYGCIAGTVCLVAILVAFLIGFHMFKKVLNQYTDTQPMALPKVEMSQDAIDEVNRRVEGFRDAVGAGRPTPRLELGADEINALIASSPDFRGARGKLYVTIPDGQLRAQVSLPMDKLGLRIFKGRYLNGTATLAISLRNGILSLTAEELLVKGKPLPGFYSERIRRENLASGINNDSRASVALNRLRSIELKEGKLILEPKQEK